MIWVEFCCLLLLTFLFKKCSIILFFFLAQKIGNTVFSFSSDSYHAICANQHITNCRNDILPSDELPGICK